MSLILAHTVPGETTKPTIIDAAITATGAYRQTKPKRNMCLLPKSLRFIPTHHYRGRFTTFDAAGS
jgi:hypothetical protein